MRRMQNLRGGLRLNRSSLTRKLPEAFYEAVPPSPGQGRATGGRMGSPFSAALRGCALPGRLPAAALYRILKAWSSSMMSGASDAGCASWSALRGASAFRSFRKILKCDLCKGWTPLPAWRAVHPPSSSSTPRTSPTASSPAPRRGYLTGLDFVSGRNLGKPDSGQETGGTSVDRPESAERA